MNDNSMNYIPLLNRVMQGDNGAIDAIISATQDMTFFYAKCLSASDDMARIISQNTYIRMRNSITQLDNALGFESWLKRLVREEAQHLLGVNQLVEPNVTDYRAELDEPLNKEPADGFTLEQKKFLVFEMIKQIPLQQRIVLLMQQFEGLSISEIASSFNATENNVKQNLTLAKEYLQNNVTDLQNKGIITFSNISPIVLFGLLTKWTHIGLNAETKGIIDYYTNTGNLPHQKSTNAQPSPEHTQPQAQPVSKQRKRKKNKKKHRFSKFLLVIVLLLTGIHFFPIVKKEYEKKKFIKEADEQFLTLDIKEDDEWTEEELIADYNDDGISNGDAIDKGLNPFVKDSDDDGIDDIDEINEYGTDPTKASTAGDVLSDTFKIVNNYDIDKNYGKEVVVNTELEIVELVIDNVEYSNFVVKNVDIALPIEVVPVVDPFSVYSFKGTAQLDVPQNCKVNQYDIAEQTLKELKTEYKDNKVTFDIENSNPIVVTDDSIIPETTSIVDFGMKSEFIVLSEPIGSRFNTVLFDTDIVNNHDDVVSLQNADPIYVYCLTNAIRSKEDTQKLQSYVEKLAPNRTIKAKYLNRARYIMLESASTLVKNIVNGIAKLIGLSLDGVFEEGNTLGVFKMDDLLELKPIVQRTDEVEVQITPSAPVVLADSGFDPDVNAIRIKNYTYQIGNSIQEGQCAGIARFYLGEFEWKTENYDLSTDEFEPFRENRAHDYVPTSESLKAYCNEVPAKEEPKDLLRVKHDELTEQDKQLTKAINELFETGNSIGRKFGIWLKELPIQFNPSEKWFSENELEAIEKEFKDGKPVIMYVKEGDNKHVVLGYKLIENFENVMYTISVEENNCPAGSLLEIDSREKLGEIGFPEKVFPEIVLSKEYENSIYGIESYYTYKYYPYGKSYTSSEKVYDDLIVPVRVDESEISD